MAANRHPDGHQNRPEWWNGISLGNAITIIGGIFVAGSVYATMQAQQNAQAEELRAVEARGKERVDLLRADVQRLEAKIDQLLTRPQ